jgi:predicted nucleic acid-binding protein
MPVRAFDTNILVYAYAEDPKAVIARGLLREGGVLCVQNLNEFANVARRKLGFSWPEITQAIDDLIALLGPPIPLDWTVHLSGRDLAERYVLSVYDALIVAAALSAECDTLYSEDMPHGLLVDGRLRIVNPFAAA